ncbi:hypothetical protein CF319_g8240 [Tilletia indica]|nr:hypothetical protein CF326_g9657 [Tilletia indica]KAE8217739.1 hypothetical protein CF319_g8240 [Tilletia indica]
MATAASDSSDGISDTDADEQDSQSSKTQSSASKGTTEGPSPRKIRITKDDSEPQLNIQAQLERLTEHPSPRNIRINDNEHHRPSRRGKDNGTSNDDESVDSVSE